MERSPRSALRSRCRRPPAPAAARHSPRVRHPHRQPPARSAPSAPSAPPPPAAGSPEQRASSERKEVLRGVGTEGSRARMARRRCGRAK
eukprot:5853315-Prymnesium_polylepis.1